MHLLFSFLIISFIFSIKKKFDLNYSQSPIIVISIVITFLYFNALYVSLNIGYFIILIIGLYSIFDNLFLFIRDKSNFYLQEECGIVSFLAFSFLLSIFSLFVQFGIWDEFTHWAPHAKYIFHNNSLYDKYIDLNHKSYPVVSALFYFPFLKYS